MRTFVSKIQALAEAQSYRDCVIVPICTFQRDLSRCFCFLMLKYVKISFRNCFHLILIQIKVICFYLDLNKYQFIAHVTTTFQKEICSLHLTFLASTNIFFQQNIFLSSFSICLVENRSFWSNLFLRFDIDVVIRMM